MPPSQIDAERVPALDTRPGVSAPRVSARPRVGPRSDGTGRLNAARGVVFGLGIGLACWLVIGAAVWLWAV